MKNIKKSSEITKEDEEEKLKMQNIQKLTNKEIFFKSVKISL